MLEALGDLKEGCRPIKSQLPPPPPHQLSTPAGRGQRGSVKPGSRGGTGGQTASPDSRTPGEGLGFRLRRGLSWGGWKERHRLALTVFSQGAQSWLVSI